MAAPRQKGKDFGAALAGLVLGGSTMFLIVLTIVWLTNRHFAAKHEAEKGVHPPPAQVAAPGPPATPQASAPPPPPPTKR